MSPRPDSSSHGPTPLMKSNSQGQVGRDAREVAKMRRFDPDADVIGSEEAARMLGLSARQVRRMAEELDGRLVSGRWTFDSLRVLEISAERRAA